MTNACTWISSSFILDSCLIPYETPRYSLSGAGGGECVVRPARLVGSEGNKAATCWCKTGIWEVLKCPSGLLLMGIGSRHNGDICRKDNQPKVGSPHAPPALRTRGALAHIMCVLELLVFYLVIPEPCAWIQQMKWLSLRGSRLLLHQQILQGRQFLVHCCFLNDLALCDD